MRASLILALFITLATSTALSPATLSSFPPTSPNPLYPLNARTLLARYCNSGYKTCGSGCIRSDYTCCPDRRGGCAPSEYCTKTPTASTGAATTAIPAAVTQMSRLSATPRSGGRPRDTRPGTIRRDVRRRREGALLRGRRRLRGRGGAMMTTMRKSLRLPRRQRRRLPLSLRLRRMTSRVPPRAVLLRHLVMGRRLGMEFRDRCRLLVRRWRRSWCCEWSGMGDRRVFLDLFPLRRGYYVG